LGLWPKNGTVPDGPANGSVLAVRLQSLGFFQNLEEKAMRNKSTRVWFGAVLICLTRLTMLSSAAELNSADFDHKYSGVDIYDGQTFLNDWSVGGDANQGDLLDGADITLNASGNIVLTQTPDNRNFWLQQDSDFSPWEEGVGLSSWTLEVRAHLIGTEIDDDFSNDGFVLWGADGIQSARLGSGADRRQVPNR
jgi:hypothetical protein